MSDECKQYFNFLPQFHSCYPIQIPSDESIPDNKTTLENVISQAGYGKFSYKLIFLCGLVVTSDAIEIISVSYILPSATCDMDLNDQKKGWINASIFVGMTIGAIFWGCLADVTGRKPVVVLSLAFNGVFNLASGLSKNLYAFLLFRLFSGFGVGGNVPVIYTYNSEFQTIEHRGKLVTFVASFWAFGGIMAAGLAWIILPINLNLMIHERYVLRSWNIYLSLCSLPSLISMCFMMLMPESPKYLLENSRIDELKKTMTKIFKQNNPDKDIINFEKGLNKLGDEKQLIDNRQISRFQEFSATIKNLFKSWGGLFSRGIIKTTVLVTLIFSIASFGYYGMFMWFPELFERSDANNGSICPTEDKLNEMKSSMNRTSIGSCEVPTSVYLQGLAVVTSKFFGYYAILLCIDKVNRKPITGVSLVLAGLCTFLIWFLKSSLQIFIASCIFGALASAVWGAVNVIVAEGFPTNLRSTAFGFCGGTGRISSAIANVVIGYLLENYCFLPFFAISGLYWIGGVISCFLKETKNLII